LKQTWSQDEANLFEKMLFLNESEHKGTKDPTKDTMSDEKRKEQDDLAE
jgi:hypothetical protein